MPTGWQQEILIRLQARDVQDKAYAEIVENCEPDWHTEARVHGSLTHITYCLLGKRLAAQTAVLKERNRSLLNAASSSRQNGTGGTATG